MSFEKTLMRQFETRYGWVTWSVGFLREQRRLGEGIVGRRRKGGDGEGGGWGCGVEGEGKGEWAKEWYRRHVEEVQAWARETGQEERVLVFDVK